MKTVAPVKSVDISQLSDDQLWNRASELARVEREATCDFVEALAEIDARRLHEKRHYASLFEYCVHKLGMSESAAYKRIRAARAIRTIPEIAAMLRAGHLTLAGVAILNPYLQDPDAKILIRQACGLRTWEVERLVAGRKVDGPRKDSIRFQAAAPTVSRHQSSDDSLFAKPGEPAPREIVPSTPPLLPTSPAKEILAAADRKIAVRVSFTADDEFYRLLSLAQSALRHKYPNGRLDGVLGDALRALLVKKGVLRRGKAK